jgi:hypothetical protein
MSKLLETRRNRVQMLIGLAISDRNALKTLQGYRVLGIINTRLNSLYSLETRFANF